jgi:hypothetical protein
MNAAPITTMPVRRPTYDNRFLRDFGRWYAANEPRLTQYYQDLSRWTTPEGDDFFGFVLCQYDLQGGGAA